MGMILKPYLNLLSPGPKQVPTGNLRIDWSHPLARGLLGCWVPGAMGANNITGFSLPLSIGSGFLIGMTPEGPGLSATRAYSGLGSVSDLVPDLFKTWTGGMSYFNRVMSTSTSVTGDMGVGFQIVYDNTSNPPYVYLGGDALTSNVYSNTNSGGTFVSTLGFNRPVLKQMGSHAATVQVGTAGLKLYVDGSFALSNNIAATPSSSSTSYITIAGAATNSIFPNFIITESCFWNRVLSANEIAWLNQEPYSFLLPDEQEESALLVPSNIILSLHQIGANFSRRIKTTGY